MNLLNMLQDQISGNMLGQAAKMLGEDKTATSTAMGAILPTVLGSLVSKGSSQSGASGIMDMLSKGNFNGSMLDNLSGLMGGGKATDNLMNSGSSILSGLLGNKLGAIVDLIGNISGLKRSSSSSLMSMAAPIVMSMLGKQASGMNPSKLMNLLSGQRSFIEKALPAGMGSLLGMGSLGASSTPSYETPSTSSSNGWWKWAALLALAAGAFWFYKNNSVVSDAVKDKVVETTNNAVDATTNAAKSAATSAGTSVGNMVDNAGNALQKAGNKIGKAYNYTTDAAGNLVDETGNVIQKAGTFSKDAAGNLVDGAGNVLQKAGEKTKNAYDATKDAAGNLVDKAGNSLQKAGEATSNAAGKVVDGAKDMAKEVGDKASDAANATKEAVKNTGKKIEKEASEVKDKMKKEF